MRLWVWSDLHLEAQERKFPDTAPAGASAIVCAGDLCHAPDLGRTAGEIVARYGLPMVFVPGNHEYYRGTFPPHTRSMAVDRRLMAEAEEASRGWTARLHVLDDGIAEIGGVRFVGGTLWTDFMMGADRPSDLPWRLNEARSLSPDFRHVRLRGDHMLEPQDMLEMNGRTRSFILDALSKPFDGPTVVVSHHLPHPAATPPVYAGEPSNFMYACADGAFANALEGSAAPELWVCGHTHHPVDLRIGRTRLVCNPAGFAAASDERSNGFRWDLSVDVEAA